MQKSTSRSWWAFGEPPRGYVNDLINLCKANGSLRSRQRVSTQGERDVKNPAEKPLFSVTGMIFIRN